MQQTLSQAIDYKGQNRMEEIRFVMIFSSRFLRVVLPTRGGPVNRHLRDLYIIPWGQYLYFSSNLSTCELATVFMQEKHKENYPQFMI